MVLSDNNIPGEITFELGKWSEEALAKRLSKIVWGGEVALTYPFKKKDSNSWDLGGNDWWLSVEGGVARLNFRYGTAYPPEYWKSLCLVIEYTLHGCHYKRGKFTKNQQ